MPWVYFSSHLKHNPLTHFWCSTGRDSLLNRVFPLCIEKCEIHTTQTQEESWDLLDVGVGDDAISPFTALRWWSALVAALSKWSTHRLKQLSYMPNHKF